MRPLALALCLLLVGCASGDRWRKRASVEEHRNFSVQIESKAGAGLGYQHPSQVAPGELADLLAALRYERSAILQKDAAKRPVFAATQATELAGALSEGLRQAGPDDRLRFYLRTPSDERPSGPRFVPMERHTRGTAWVAPAGVLNIAFDVVDEPLQDAPAERRDPGDSKRTRVALVLPDGVSRYEENGVQRPLWLVWAWAADLPAPSGEPAHADPAPQPAEPPDDAEAETLTKLRFLEELRRDGAIDEAEYERRKNALLFGEDGGTNRPESEEDSDPPAPPAAVPESETKEERP